LKPTSTSFSSKDVAACKFVMLLFLVPYLAQCHEQGFLTFDVDDRYEIEEPQQIQLNTLVGFRFFKNKSLTPGLAKQQVVSLSQSPEANHAGWPDVSAMVDLCLANWYSQGREIIDFSYFPNFKKMSR